MRYALLAFSLFAACLAAAQSPPAQVFPDDFTPSACAPEQPCVSFSQSELLNAAFAFNGYQIDARWLDAHYDELTKLYAPICRKLGTCLGTAGNNFLFCDDIISAEFRQVCDKRFPESQDKRDHEQCQFVTDTWLLGVDQHALAIGTKAQECVHAKGLEVMHAKPPVIWTWPDKIPNGYTGYIWVYALDPDTHVPVKADLNIEGETIYAPANPVGNIATGYPFHWKPTFKRIKNAEGHDDLAPRTLTITAPYYPTVTMLTPTTPPRMVVEISPSLDKLKPGTHEVTVTAKDAETGKPVEGRVMVGDMVAGETNQPFELVVKKGQKPDVWVTNLFNAYGDVVVK
jgi:hypothetical protein